MGDIQYVLNEGGLFQIIFGYLSYEDILNGVYKLNGWLHQLSIPVLNYKYSNYVNFEFFNYSIYKNVKYIHPNLEIRKDSVILLNALMVDMMDKIINQINTTYSNKETTSNIDLLLIYRKADMFGELGVHAQSMVNVHL